MNWKETHLFIINPAAGKRDMTRELSRKIHRICGDRGLQYEIVVSKQPGDCCKAARAAAESGKPYRIYACGGDGTLNEVVNGAAGFPNVSVTHYAGGSGNDFVKIFGDVAPFRDLEQLLDSRETEFDLVECGGEYAVNVCSVGFDARIGTQVAQYKRIPLMPGTVAYLLSAVVNTLKGITEHYVVEVNGETIDGEMTMVCVCNGSFYGGGFHPVPEASPCDGLLDVLLVKPVTRLQILRFIGLYRQGKYRQLPELVRHLRTRELTIRCIQETSVNMDGELRHSSQTHICLSPVKLRFFYPGSLHWSPAGTRVED